MWPAKVDKKSNSFIVGKSRDFSFSRMELDSGEKSKATEADDSWIEKQRGSGVTHDEMAALREENTKLKQEVNEQVRLRNVPTERLKDVHKIETIQHYFLLEQLFNR